MGFLTQLTTSLAACIAVTSALTTQQRDLFIVGGDLAKAGDAPYVVSVQLSAGKEWEHHCGGVLLNANTVLTAAHCTQMFEDMPTYVHLRVRAGSLGGTVRNVSKAFHHNNYNDITIDYDVAILKLSAPLGSGFKYATLPEVGSIPIAGVNSMVFGWGYLKEHGDKVRYLRKVSIPVVDRGVCQNEAKNYKHRDNSTAQITSRMFCAGFAEGGKGSCHEDSGGPIIDTASGNVEGLVSWEYHTSCGAKDSYGVFSRLGEKSIADFIKNHTHT